MLSDWASLPNEISERKKEEEKSSLTLTEDPSCEISPSQFGGKLAGNGSVQIGIGFNLPWCWQKMLAI